MTQRVKLYVKDWEENWSEYELTWKIGKEINFVNFCYKNV